MAQDVLFGRVYEEKTGKPLTEVDITLPSGKKISQNRDDGRFELAIPSRNGRLLFKRNGFDTDTLQLGQINDLFNVEIYLNSSLKTLDKSSVTTAIKPKKSNTIKVLSPENLELYTGMQLDIAQQIRMIPGVTATQEFKDENSFLGGAQGDNLSSLGPFRLEETRHLDIGLPGNNSVISSNWINKFVTHSSVSYNRPLASAEGDVEMQLKPVNADGLKGVIKGGTVLREIELETPFWGDGLRVGFRVLDGSLIENIGDKYFAEFRKRSDDDTCIDPCKSSNFGNRYALTSWDAFVQTGYQDSTGKLELIYHNLQDNYSVKLDTSRTYSVLSNQRVEIFSGDQANQLMGAHYQANSGWGIYGSFQIGENQSIQRDSAALWSTDINSSIYREDQVQLENVAEEYSLLNTGFHLPIAEIGAGLLDFGFELNSAKRERLFRMPSILDESVEDELEMGFVASYSYLRSVKLNLGYKSEIENALGAVVGGAEYSKKIDDLRVYTQVAQNGDVVWENYSAKGYQARYESNTLGQLSLEYQSSNLLIDAFGYGRYYPEASLPRPDVFNSYQMRTPSSAAWIGGGGIQVRYAPHYQHGIALSLSSQYGEYESPKSLPFNANRSLDLTATYKWHPRMDSLVAIIITHRASVGEPTYNYLVDLDEETLAVQHSSTELEAHRTDIRMQLNLMSAWPPLESVQFYLEFNNIFEAFGADAISLLGDDNARQRGWTTAVISDFEEGYRNLEPYYAPGMGFFIQFGIEGRFGF